MFSGKPKKYSAFVEIVLKVIELQDLKISNVFLLFFVFVFDFV